MPQWLCSSWTSFADASCHPVIRQDQRYISTCRLHIVCLVPYHCHYALTIYARSYCRNHLLSRSVDHILLRPRWAGQPELPNPSLFSATLRNREVWSTCMGDIAMLLCLDQPSSYPRTCLWYRPSCVAASHRCLPLHDLTTAFLSTRLVMSEAADPELQQEIFAAYSRLYASRVLFRPAGIS